MVTEPEWPGHDEAAVRNALRKIHGECEYCDGGEDYPNAENPCADGVNLLLAYHAGIAAGLDAAARVAQKRAPNIADDILDLHGDPT